MKLDRLRCAFAREAREIAIWLRRHGPSTFFAFDFLLGFLVFGFVCLLAGTQEAVRTQATTVLVAESALGAGLVAVVLGALVILVTFFDHGYRQVLEKTPGEVPGAIAHYRTVAVVGGLTAMTGLASALAWPALPSELQTLLLALTSCFFTWAAVGTIQLVEITAHHAVERSKLLGTIDQAQGLPAKPRKRSV